MAQAPADQKVWLSPANEDNIDDEALFADAELSSSSSYATNSTRDENDQIQNQCLQEVHFSVHNDCEPQCHKHYFNCILYNAEADIALAQEVKEQLELHTVRHLKPRVGLMHMIKFSSYYDSLHKASEMSQIIVFLYTKEFEKCHMTENGTKALWPFSATNGLEFAVLMVGFDEKYIPKLAVARDAHRFQYKPGDKLFEVTARDLMERTMPARCRHDQIRHQCERQMIQTENFSTSKHVVRPSLKNIETEKKIPAPSGKANRSSLLPGQRQSKDLAPVATEVSDLPSDDITTDYKSSLMSPTTSQPGFTGSTYATADHRISPNASPFSQPSSDRLSNRQEDGLPHAGVQTTANANAIAEEGVGATCISPRTTQSDCSSGDTKKAVGSALQQQQMAHLENEPGRPGRECEPFATLTEKCVSLGPGCPKLENNEHFDSDCTGRGASMPMTFQSSCMGSPVPIISEDHFINTTKDKTPAQDQTGASANRIGDSAEAAASDGKAKGEKRSTPLPLNPSETKVPDRKSADQNRIATSAQETAFPALNRPGGMSEDQGRQPTNMNKSRGLSSTGGPACQNQEADCKRTKTYEGASLGPADSRRHLTDLTQDGAPETTNLRNIPIDPQNTNLPRDSVNMGSSAPKSCKQAQSPGKCCSDAGEGLQTDAEPHNCCPLTTTAIVGQRADVKNVYEKDHPAETGEDSQGETHYDYKEDQRKKTSRDGKEEGHTIVKGLYDTTEYGSENQYAGGDTHKITDKDASIAQTSAVGRSGLNLQDIIMEESGDKISCPPHNAAGNFRSATDRLKDGVCTKEDTKTDLANMPTATDGQLDETGLKYVDDDDFEGETYAELTSRKQLSVSEISESEIIRSRVPLTFERNVHSEREGILSDSQKWSAESELDNVRGVGVEETLTRENGTDESDDDVLQDTRSVDQESKHDNKSVTESPEARKNSQRPGEPRKRETCNVGLLQTGQLYGAAKEPDRRAPEKVFQADDSIRQMRQPSHTKTPTYDIHKYRITSDKYPVQEEGAGRSCVLALEGEKPSTLADKAEDAPKCSSTAQNRCHKTDEESEIQTTHSTPVGERSSHISIRHKQQLRPVINIQHAEKLIITSCYGNSAPPERPEFHEPSAGTSSSPRTERDAGHGRPPIALPDNGVQEDGLGPEAPVQRRRKSGLFSRLLCCGSQRKVKKPTKKRKEEEEE